MNWAKRHLWEPGIVTYYREQAMQAYREGRINDMPASMLKYLRENPQ